DTRPARFVRAAVRARLPAGARGETHGAHRECVPGARAVARRHRAGAALRRAARSAEATLGCVNSARANPSLQPAEPPVRSLRGLLSWPSLPQALPHERIGSLAGIADRGHVRGESTDT